MNDNNTQYYAKSKRCFLQAFFGSSAYLRTILILYRIVRKYAEEPFLFYNKQYKLKQTNGKSVDANCRLQAIQASGKKYELYIFVLNQQRTEIHDIALNSR